MTFNTNLRATPSQEPAIKVMLVDDSAVIRGALKRILDKIEGIEVISSVADGETAVKIVGGKKPDIVILDIEMPVMDGLTALPKILESSPNSKVIMFSSLTEKGASVTLKALRLGAVECLVKPSSTQDVGEGSPFQQQMIALIQNLSENRVPNKATSLQARSTAPASKSAALNTDPLIYKGKPHIVAIGSSTGGPQALFNVLKHCAGFPVPIVITQHMPATFTKILAEHIQQQTGIEAHEGADGMMVEAGKVYVAPGGKHMLIKRNGTDTQIVLDDGPLVNYCKPAVDPMYNSLLEVYGNKMLGVILTGMGHDGLGGGKALVEKHGRLIAQDEATSVVWGMPGAVAQAGLCSDILPLNDIGPAIKRAVLG